MEKEEPKLRNSIVFKTASACGIIILILLAISSFFSIRLQSELTESIIEQFISTQKITLDEESVQMKKSLVTNMTVNLETCTSVAQSLLYNFDQKQLYTVLSSYLKLDGMVAIKVLDADGEPFGAAWKNSGISTGEILPDFVKVDENLSIVADASHENEKVGSVRLYYTNDFVNKSIKAQEAQTQKSIAAFQGLGKTKIDQSITSQLIVAVVIIIVLIVTLVACLQMIVTRPINQTVAMIKDIAQGEGDLTKRLSVKTHDE